MDELTPDECAEIAALVGLALAGLQLGEDANPPIGALVNTVGERYGMPGVRQIARHCGRMTIEGVDPAGMPGGFTWALFGTEANRAIPGTTPEYHASHYMVALMNDRGADAEALLARLQPDDTVLSEDFFRFLVQMTYHAWLRQRGKGLSLHINAGNTWPPVCDFCVEVVARWMFRCRPFQIGGATRPDGAMGIVDVQFADVERWYACGTCATLVEARNIEGLLTRYLQLHNLPREPMRVHNLTHVWRTMIEHRRRPKRYPLPKTNPNLEPADVDG